MFPYGFGYFHQMQPDHFVPPQQQGPGPAGSAGGPIRMHFQQQQPSQIRQMPYVVPPNTQQMRHIPPPSPSGPHYAPMNINQQQFPANLPHSTQRPPQMQGQPQGPPQIQMEHIQPPNIPPQQMPPHPMPLASANQQPSVSQQQQFTVPNPPPPAPQPAPQMQLNNLVLGSIMDKARLDELMAQINKNTVLEDNVKDVLIEYTDDLITSIIDKACRLIKNRDVKKIETRDIEFILQNVYNMPVVPRAAVHIFGAPETIDLGKERHLATEAHKQRLAMLKKQLKKI